MAKKAVCAAAVALLLVLSQTAFAAPREGTFTISPMIGGYLFEGDQRLKHSANYGAALGYNFSEHVGAEAVVGFIDSGVRRVGDQQMDVYLFRLDALYHFRPQAALQPYLAAGAGAAIFDSDPGGSDSRALFNWGGGLEYFITDRIALRGDVRHVITFDQTFHNLSYTAGMTVFLGGPGRRPLAAVPGPVERIVTGEKPPEEKAPPVAERAPEPARPRELCLMLKVNFDFDKADIKPEFEGEVGKVATFMKENPDARGRIVGYADAVGPEEYNVNLSRRRAEAVKDYLVSSFGIAADRLDTEGRGEAEPVASNLTEEGRAENRRAVRVFCSTGRDMAAPKPKRVCVGMKVQFDSGSAEIKPEYRPEIKRVADYMKEHPDQVGTIEGYADAAGPDELNMRLSQQRADAVREYMIKEMGIPGDRLRTHAVGEARPVADNTTPEGRAQNRYAVEMFCEPAE